MATSLLPDGTRTGWLSPPNGGVARNPKSACNHCQGDLASRARGNAFTRSRHPPFALQNILRHLGRLARQSNTHAIHQTSVKTICMSQPPHGWVRLTALNLSARCFYPAPPPVPAGITKDTLFNYILAKNQTVAMGGAMVSCHFGLAKASKLPSHCSIFEHLGAGFCAWSYVPIDNSKCYLFTNVSCQHI
jgi:hypothetical protein